MSKAIEAVRLRRGAKRGATMRPALPARRAGNARRAPDCASRAPRSRNEAITLSACDFMGRGQIINPLKKRVNPTSFC